HRQTLPCRLRQYGLAEHLRPASASVLSLASPELVSWLAWSRPVLGWPRGGLAPPPARRCRRELSRIELRCFLSSCVTPWVRKPLPPKLMLNQIGSQLIRCACRAIFCQGA